MIRRAPGLVEQALPYNKEAEVAFLGAILLDSKGVCDEMERLDSSDFFLPFHQVIFRALKKLKAAGKPTNDLVVLHDALRETNDLEAAGGAYISTLVDGLPKVSNISHYAEIIKTRATARRYITQADANIDRLLGANGNLVNILREIDSALLPVEFDFDTLFRPTNDHLNWPTY